MVLLTLSGYICLQTQDLMTTTPDTQLALDIFPTLPLGFQAEVTALPLLARLALFHAVECEDVGSGRCDVAARFYSCFSIFPGTLRRVKGS